MDPVTPVEKLQYLEVPLPETISSYKYYGDFDSEIRAIDAFLARKNIPSVLRERLNIERIIANGMKNEFLIIEEEAFSWFCDNYENFTHDEFDKMMDDGTLEWRFIKGKRHLSNSFKSSISMKLKDLYERRKDKTPYTPSEKTKLIHAAIKEMQEKGYAKRRIRIRQELKVKKESERVGENIRVDLPFPQNCDEQSDIVLVASSHPCEIGKLGQSSVMIKTKLKADETFFVEYEYTLCVRYKKIDYSQPSCIPEYVPGMYGEQHPHIVKSPLIEKTAKEICGDETNPIKKARLIYDYVTENLRYSYMREYLLFENIPAFALTSFLGDCGVMALLFISLCRAVDIPAGWQSGLSVLPFRVSSHDWATFFLYPYGQLYADLSGGEDAVEKGDDVRRDHYFGNLDPFRMIANDTFMFDFERPSKYLRNDPYDNQSGEAEYDDRALAANELYRTKILKKYEVLE